MQSKGIFRIGCQLARMRRRTQKRMATGPPQQAISEYFSWLYFSAADHHRKLLSLRRWSESRALPESTDRQTQLLLAGRRPSPDFAREFFTLTAKGRSSTAIWRSNQYSA